MMMLVKLPRRYWILWVGQLVNRTGLVAPAFLIIYVQMSSSAGDATVPSLIAGLYGAGIVVAGLLGGVIADLVGPRRFILLILPVATAVALLFLVTENLIVIGALSFGLGIMTTAERPAGASLIAEMVSRDHFPKAYGYHLIGFNVGTTLSLVLAGFFLQVYPEAIFIMWASCSAIYWVFASLLPKGQTSDGKPRVTVRSLGSDLVEPYRSPQIIVFLGLCFVLALIYLQSNTTLPLHMLAEGISSAGVGLVLALNAVLTIALLPFVPKLVSRWADTTPLVLAAVFMAVGFGMNAVATAAPVFIIAVCVWTIGEVLWAPMSASYLAARAPDGRTSSYMSSYFFTWNMAFLIGGPIGIIVADGFGFPFLWASLFCLGIFSAICFKVLARPTSKRDAEAAPG